MNLSQLDKRLSNLREMTSKKAYEKQKSSLQLELENFLHSLPSPKTIYDTTPLDITRFLVWKDQKGKTKVHVPACKFFGTKTAGQCRCPVRLAAGTVDNTIGKLRSIFVDIGRPGEWQEAFGAGNPASHKSVRRYLRAVQEEQAIARVTPKQAKPIFSDKLSLLCSYLKEQVFSLDLPPIQRFLFARDLAFFSVDFFAGDRASDLGRIFTKEILVSNKGDTLLFRHTFGKTLRGKDTNSFMMKMCSDKRICPIANLRLYVQLCDLLTINLRDGHLTEQLTERVGYPTSPLWDQPSLTA